MFAKTASLRLSLWIGLVLGIGIVTWFSIATAQAPPNFFVPGRLFVADANVKIYEPDGTFVSLIDDPVLGQAGDVAFNYVRNLLYVADRSNGTVVAFDETGAVVQIIGPAPGESIAWGTSVDSFGTTYVVGNGGRINVFDNDGNVIW